MYTHLGSILLSAFLVAIFSLAATTKIAHAYIEIGSATLMFQMLLASSVAGLFAIKMFWGRITEKISRFFAKVKNPKQPIE